MVLQRRASGGGGAQLGRATGCHAREPVEPLSLERRQPGHADHAQHPLAQQRAAGQGVVGPAGMAKHREAPDAKGVGDAGDVGRHRCQVPSRLRSRAAVPRPVMRQPADAMLCRPREQGFGRRAEVRGAVLPEHHQGGVGLTWRGVIDIQRAPVAQHEIGLGHHRPSIPSDRDRADARSESLDEHVQGLRHGDRWPVPVPLHQVPTIVP